jgi:glycosyltransferase involved in cell wall biosynthesis
LALALADAGFDVTVAYADADENGPRVKDGDFLELQASYRQLGITLDFVPAAPLVAKAFEDPRSASYCVYLYLQQHEFDVVYFNDCGGQGYYSLMAKRVGVFRNPPVMYVVSHGPQEWVLELNSLHYWDKWPVITAYMERRSAALADALISPSRYLVDWMTSHGWVMPADVLVVPNIVPLPESVRPLEGGASAAEAGMPAGDVAPRWRGGDEGGSAERREPTAITEIVFFGRLEVRKGLELFCNAIDLLNRSADLSDIRITFMGKFARMGGLHSGIYVVERARRWRSSLRILSRYGQEEALEYLQRPGVLAVIPSRAENSPCAVAECLQLALPFLATDSGGTAELVAPEDRDLCLFPLDPGVLAARLGRILQSGHRAARSAISRADTLATWLRLTEHGAAKCDAGATVVSDLSAPSPEAQRNGAEVPPLVSVCLAHGLPSFATEALLDSLLRQNYPRLEFILPKGGNGREAWASKLAACEAAGERITLRVFPGTPCDRAAARNAAAAQASGEYLLFVEEDSVVLVPECIGAFVTAAQRTGANIVTGVPLDSRHRGGPAGGQNGQLNYFPLGACVELGAFENCFGKGILLVDRLSFEQGGGFATGCDPAIDDWLFLATSVLSGLHLEVVPQPLFWHRTGRPKQLSSSQVVDNHRRIFEAYASQELRKIRPMLESILNVERANEEQLREMLADASSEALEIALRVLSSGEPNDAAALRGFVQFCLERYKIQEAFDFALHNGPSFLSDAIGSATGIAEQLAFDAVRRPTLDLWHDIALTEEVRQRLTPVSTPLVEGLVQPAGGIATHSIQTGVTVLKAATVCPPATRKVRVAATVDAPGPSSIFLAFAVSRPEAQLGVSEQGIVSKEVFWWSGWVPAGCGRLELFVPIAEPTENPLDLYLLCKRGEEDADAGVEITWDSVTATISVNDTLGAAAKESTQPGTPMPLQVLERGVLLSSNPFPFPIFVPGVPTLLHPVPDQVSFVRLSGAVPPGTKGIRSVVSLARSESHPVEFAVWIRPSSAPVAKETEFTDADPFSGWFSVQQTLRRRHFTLTLREAISTAMDLYLGTRVSGYPDAYFCHAMWHQILILE